MTTPEPDAVLQGSTGNDVFHNGTGNDRIDGGAGIDTLISRGKLADYSLRYGYANVLESFYDMGVHGGSDYIKSVERLLFDDVALALDIDGAAGQAYRLYRAAFDRVPDLEGLGFWIQALDNGVSLQSVSRDFIRSSEFQRLYGSNPTDEQFLHALYQNVLDRAPDQEGLKFWTDALHNGVSREQILVDFSESFENQDITLPGIRSGIQYLVY